MELKGSWEDHLHLVEFVYINSYQSSIQMVPYEALDGRPCKLPLCWMEIRKKSILEPDLVLDTYENI